MSRVAAARHPLVLALVLLLAPTAPLRAQQVADSTFDTRVVRPAFAARHPVVRIDEAHLNFHTATGRYKVFADLVASDGCRVERGAAPFTAASLRGCDVLVISNALGAEDMASPEAEHAAFTDAECDAVRDWVRGGGALLLIADHAPMGAAARPLGARFGVDMRNAYCMDPGPGNAAGNPGMCTFTAAYGLDTTHVIVRGRDAGERVRTVMTFTGQSLKGPPGSVSLLTFGPTAQDLMVGFGQARGEIPDSLRASADGRSQALAFAFGKGRVVVLGEAAMLSAQLAGPGGRMKVGMNVEGIDNRQLALNIVRWLARAPGMDARR
jgi:hypothetical protein